MDLGLISSAWAQAGRETAFGIQKTREIGFDSIDIFADPLDIDVRERKLIKDACDKLGGEPETACHCRRIGGRRSTGAFVDRTAGSLTEPFAETLKPRGESGLFGRGVTVIAVIARHLENPRIAALEDVPRPSKPRGPY